MKKYLSMLVALAVTLFAATSFAWTPPASPAPASWISDTSHVLSDDAHARLDAKLKKINQSSANEIAALVLQTLDGQDIADVTNATFKSWGVGKRGLDNGVLVVLAIKDRKMRIETGKGVEGDLPDLKTQDIQVNVMRPRLRSGDVEGALGAGFDAIASSIANHKADVAAGRNSRQAPSCQTSNVGSSSGGGWILLFVAGGTIGLVWYLARQAKRRRQEEEAQRLAAQERQAARRRQIEEREAARRRDAEHQRQLLQSRVTPAVVAPTVPRPTPVAPTVRKKPSVPRPTPSVVAPVAPYVAAAAAEEEQRRAAAAAARRRREQEESDARRARERADEDRRRRDREEEDRRSSYSSSSSSSPFDWGGSSGGSDSGGFGGGDSGGGGSSSDW